MDTSVTTTPHRLWILMFIAGMALGALLDRAVLANVKGFEPIPSCAPIVDNCVKR